MRAADRRAFPLAAAVASALTVLAARCHAAPGYYLHPNAAPAAAGAWDVLPEMAGIVLTYAVLGRPLWAAALAFAPGPVKASPTERSWLAIALGIAARLALAACCAALIELPAMSLLASIAVLAAILQAAPTAAPPQAAAPTEEDPPSPLATLVAATVNDALSAASGVLALALLARGNWPLLGAALLLALAAALPPAMAARRWLRRSLVRFGVAAVLLTVIVGMAMLRDATAVLGLPMLSLARAGAVVS